MPKAARPINESNRSLSQYLEEIGKYEPLHPSREVELAQAIKKIPVADTSNVIAKSDALFFTFFGSINCFK